MFIRALWGIYNNPKRMYRRRSKIDNDIKMVSHNIYQPPFMTYVFGSDNYNYLVDQGFSCKLIDNKPIVWDMNTQQFRHKFEVFKYALEDYGKFVFLDWDMAFIKPLPRNFWDTLSKKAPIQAILRIYHNKKALWRKEKPRTIPCGSFVYIREKKIGDDLIKYWEAMGKPWGEEVVIAKYIDDKMGGFDMDKYWDYYEPLYFKFQNMYSEERMKTKIPLIEHFNCYSVKSLLSRINTKKCPAWLKK